MSLSRAEDGYTRTDFFNELTRIESLNHEFTFTDLLRIYMKVKGLSVNDFEVETGLSKQRIYDAGYFVQVTREMAWTICIGLGLNLLLVEIFMYYAGHSLNPSCRVVKSYKKVKSSFA